MVFKCRYGNMCHTSPSFPSGYELERKDSPGEFVNLTSSLSNQGTMDFMLVRNISECFVLVGLIM